MAPCFARSGVVTVIVMNFGLEYLTLNSGVSIFTHRCLDRSARISIMTKYRVTKDSSGELPVFVNDVTHLHTLTKKPGTLFDWLTKVILTYGVEVPVEKTFRY